MRVMSLVALPCRPCLRALGMAVALLVVAPVPAQVPPSSAERSAYTGPFAAALTGDVAAIRAAGGTAIDARDGHGRTPLHVAAFASQRGAIRALVAAGADTAALENDRYDAVTIAAVSDDEETLQALLDLGASAKLVTSRYDGTALIAAAHLGHDGVVRRLIASGAPVDHVNNLGWTALIEAVVLGDGGPRHQACVRHLLSGGADRRIADRGGRTPLDLARARGYTAMVALLEGPETRR